MNAIDFGQIAYLDEYFNDVFQAIPFFICRILQKYPSDHLHILLHVIEAFNCPFYSHRLHESIWLNLVTDTQCFFMYICVWWGWKGDRRKEYKCVHIPQIFHGHLTINILFHLNLPFNNIEPNEFPNDSHFDSHNYFQLIFTYSYAMRSFTYAFSTFSSFFLFFLNFFVMQICSGVSFHQHNGRKGEHLSYIRSHPFQLFFAVSPDKVDIIIEINCVWKHFYVKSHGKSIRWRNPFE